MGLQGSLGGRGDDSFSVKAFLAVATPFNLFFTIFVEDTGMLGFPFIKDFGDSKGEGNFLYLDLEETAVEDLLWNVFDAWECGLGGLEDKTGLWGDLDSDLGESGGLGVTPDCGFGDDEGILMSFKSIWGVGMFLDVCQEVLRKPEFRRGRFWNISPNSSIGLPWKKIMEKQQKH